VAGLDHLARLVSAVNALSDWLKLEILPSGKVYYQEYSRGMGLTASKPRSAGGRADASSDLGYATEDAMEIDEVVPHEAAPGARS
jgi:DNA gyrase/topoisomerase IV subunit B